MTRMKYGRRSGRGNLIGTLIALLLILCLLTTAVDARIRPIITTVSSSRAKNISTQLINEAVAEVLERDGVTYDELVDLRTDGEGNVTALQVDAVRLNTLKSELSTAVAEKIAEVDGSEIGIPVGTLFGSDLLSGRGSELKIRLELGGNVVTDLRSEFVSSGINQTHHRIMLNVKTSIYAIITGYSTSTDIDTSVSIAESVIVGGVPEAYTNVDVIDDDAKGDIDDILNNYGAVVE